MHVVEVDNLKFGIFPSKHQNVGFSHLNGFSKTGDLVRKKIKRWFYALGSIKRRKAVEFLMQMRLKRT